MNPKKKSRRCRGLGLDSGLDLAISRFSYSFGFRTVVAGVTASSCCDSPPTAYGYGSESGHISLGTYQTRDLTSRAYIVQGTQYLCYFVRLLSVGDTLLRHHKFLAGGSNSRRFCSAFQHCIYRFQTMKDSKV